MEGDSPLLQLIGYYSSKLYDEADLIQMYGHLLLSALFPIYIGSHASLRRPPSAAKPTKKSKLTLDTNADEDDDETEIEQPVDGLTPTDAIIFPILAGFTLTGLYLLLKWLKDPALLNKILGWYFSTLGVFGVGKLAGDALNVGTSFVFPSVYSTRGRLYHIDALLQQVVTGSVGKVGKTQIHRKFVEDKTTPLPGVFSQLRFSSRNSERIWTVRALFLDTWVFRGYVHGLVKIRSNVRLNDVIGLVFGVGAIALYNVLGKPWWLTNLMGFGFCYGTLQLMSPTTFWTGTLVLAGLFVYDITMVFYT